MPGFEIHHNGKRLCLAAAEKDESLSLIMAYGRGEQFLDVSGSVGPKPTFPKWVEMLRLNIGDEIVVKVIDTAQGDAPVRVGRTEDLWPNKKR
jgi:hypothetical protein